MLVEGKGGLQHLNAADSLVPPLTRRACHKTAKVSYAGQREPSPPRRSLVNVRENQARAYLPLSGRPAGAVTCSCKCKYAASDAAPVVLVPLPKGPEK